MSPQGIVGWVRTSKPANWIRNPHRSSWTVDPLAVDGAFQLAAYWAWSHLQRAGFPIGIEEFVQVAPLGEGPVRASLTLEQSSGSASPLRSACAIRTSTSTSASPTTLR